MKYEVEEVSPMERKLSIEVPAERVREEFEHVLGEVSRRTRIKGFRPGRVPRAIMEQRFAADVRRQVAQDLVRQALTEAITEAKLDVVAQSDLEMEPLRETEALRFSAKVELRPTVGTVSTDALVASRPVVAVTDEDVDKVLEQLRLRYAQLQPVADRSDVSRGDFATIDIAADLDGQPLPGLSSEGVTVEAAAGQLPGDVDERLAIARLGETFSVETSPPEGAPKELDGRKVRYTVTVKSIAERILPTLDDEFAKDHGDSETLADLRGRLAQDLEREGNRRADASLRESLMDLLIQRNPIEMPPSLIGARVEQLLDELKIDLMQRGLRFTSNEHEDEARQKLEPRARRDLAGRIILDAVADQLEIHVGDDELAERIGQILSASGKHRDRLREHYTDPRARDAVRSDMSRARALERLVSLADVQNVERSGTAQV